MRACSSLAHACSLLFKALALLLSDEGGGICGTLVANGNGTGTGTGDPTNGSLADVAIQCIGLLFDLFPNSVVGQYLGTTSDKASLRVVSSILGSEAPIAVKIRLAKLTAVVLRMVMSTVEGGPHLVAAFVSDSLIKPILRQLSQTEAATGTGDGMGVIDEQRVRDVAALTSYSSQILELGKQ
jgi:hypothetical protein